MDALSFQEDPGLISVLEVTGMPQAVNDLFFTIYYKNLETLHDLYLYEWASNNLICSMFIT